MSKMLGTLLGLCTTAFISWINFKIKVWTSFDFASCFIFVIPIGAYIIGVMAGLGYGIGVQAKGGDISPADLLPGIGFGILAFILTHWFRYEAEIPEIHMSPSDFFSFTEYLGWSFSHATLSIFLEVHHHHKHIDTGWTMGWVGYLVMALEVLGFSFGSATAVGAFADADAT